MFSIPLFSVIKTHLKCIIIIICLFSILYNGFSAFGQTPYPLYLQAYLPLLQNSLLNSLNTRSAYGLFPYAAGSFNPLLSSLYSPVSPIQTPLSTQATIAGGLLPFNNTFNIPYNPLTNYLLGGAALPTPYNYYFYNAAGPYFAVATITADVAGSWTGTWTSTFLPGGVTTGDLSITLAQINTEVTGTVVFLLNKILKFGASVVGTVDGNTLLLTSTVVPGAGGTKSFDVTLTATVDANNMKGTYVVINNVTGNTAEEGTFAATKL